MLALALMLLNPDVVWTDDSGRCADGRARVEAAAEGLDDATIAVEVSTLGDGLRAEVRLRTPDGADMRTLESPSCGTLTEAVVLIARAAVQASVPPPPAHPPEPKPEPVPVPLAAPVLDPQPVAPEAEPRPTAADAPAPPPPTQRLELRGLLRAFGLASFGLTPRWSGGGGLALGLGGDHWSAEAFGVVQAPSQTGATPGIRAWAWSAGARGCGHLGPFGIVQPGLCAAAEVGRLAGRSTGEGVINRRPHADTWVGASLGPSLRVFVVPWLAVVLDLEALAVLRRPAFAIAGDVEFRASVVVPRATLGLEARFGPR